jgi:hypothetical protein
MPSPTPKAVLPVSPKLEAGEAGLPGEGSEADVPVGRPVSVMEAVVLEGDVGRPLCDVAIVIVDGVARVVVRVDTNVGDFSVGGAGGDEETSDVEVDRKVVDDVATCDPE